MPFIWQRNRHGGLAGGILVSLHFAIFTAFGTNPFDYVVGRTAIPIEYALSIILAGLFIRPVAAWIMVIIQIGFVAWASRMVGISWDSIAIYCEIAIITLACVAAISSIAATVFTRAIRNAVHQAQRADAANMQLEQANTKLEQKVRERTQALTDTNQQLAQVMEAREHEIATVIHDLGHGASMLMGVMNTTLFEVAQHGAPASVMEAAWDGLQLARRNYERLVEDLRDAVRLQHDVLHLRPQSVHLDELLGEVITTMQLHEASHPIPGILTLQADAALPPVWVDPDRIRRVMYNLIGNALQYSREAENGPHVVIQLQADDARRMCVTYNGLKNLDSLWSYRKVAYYGQKGLQFRLQSTACLRAVEGGKNTRPIEQRTWCARQCVA